METLAWVRARVEVAIAVPLSSQPCASVVPEVVCGKKVGFSSRDTFFRVTCIGAPFSFSVTEHKDEL